MKRLGVKLANVHHTLSHVLNYRHLCRKWGDQQDRESQPKRRWEMVNKEVKNKVWIHVNLNCWKDLLCKMGTILYYPDSSHFKDDGIVKESFQKTVHEWIFKQFEEGYEPIEWREWFRTPTAKDITVIDVNVLYK